MKNGNNNLGCPSNFLRSNALAITVQVVAFLVVVVNLWIASQLRPLVQDISLIQQAIAKVEESTADKVSKGEFNQLCNHLDKISGRLDEVITILMQR